MAEGGRIMLTVDIRKRVGTFTLRLLARCEHRVTGLFGPSGSGKTTVLDCIAGALAPDSGEIRLNDTVFCSTESAMTLPVRRRRVGYVFQDSLLFEHKTVRANLLYGHRGDGGGPAFDDVVDVLGLRFRLDRRPRELSGGEQRRVAIGRALLSAPSLLLLDEPLTGLDAALAGQVMVYLKRVLDRFDIPAVYVSHSISDVIYFCDEVIVLNGGRAVAKGPPAEVIARRGVLDDRHLADLQNVFIAADARYDADRHVVRCRVGGSELTIYSATHDRTPAPTLSLRANDIILAAQRPERISARNIVPAVVKRIERVDGKVLVFIDVGPTWIVEVGPAAVSELRLGPGSEVFAVVKASAIAVL